MQLGPPLAHFICEAKGLLTAAKDANPVGGTLNVNSVELVSFMHFPENGGVGAELVNDAQRQSKALERALPSFFLGGGYFSSSAVACNRGNLPGFIISATRSLLDVGKEALALNPSSLALPSAVSKLCNAILIHRIAIPSHIKCMMMAMMLKLTATAFIILTVFWITSLHRVLSESPESSQAKSYSRTENPEILLLKQSHSYLASERSAVSFNHLDRSNHLLNNLHV